MTNVGNWLALMVASAGMLCTNESARAQAGDHSGAAGASMIRIAQGSAAHGSPGGGAGNVDSLSPYEQDLRASYVERQRVRDAVIDSCVKGTALGAIAGAIFRMKEDKEVKAKHVILGGIAGCGIGALVGRARGKYVHAKAQNYAQNQEAEQRLIAGLQEDIAYYREMNMKTAALVGAERDKITALNEEFAAKTLSAEDYRGRISGREDTLEALRDTIRDASDNIELVNSDIAKLRAASLSTTSFEQKLSELHSERAGLTAKLQGLESAYAAIPASVTAGKT